MTANPGELEALGDAAVQSMSAEVTGRSPTRIAFDRLRKDKVAVVCVGRRCCSWSLLGAVRAADHASASDIYWDITRPGRADARARSSSSTATRRSARRSTRFTWDHPLGLAPQTGVRQPRPPALRPAHLAGRRPGGHRLLAPSSALVIGLVAGFSRGWLDRIISFIIDLFLSFPFLLGDAGAGADHHLRASPPTWTRWRGRSSSR